MADVEVRDASRKLSQTRKHTRLPDGREIIEVFDECGNETERTTVSYGPGGLVARVISTILDPTSWIETTEVIASYDPAGALLNQTVVVRQRDGDILTINVPSDFEAGPDVLLCQATVGQDGPLFRTFPSERAEIVEWDQHANLTLKYIYGGSGTDQSAVVAELRRQIVY